MMFSATYPATATGSGRRRERRGVSLLHFHQIIDRTFMLDDKRDFVNSFVYTVIADDLSAVQLYLSSGRKVILILSSAWHPGNILRERTDGWSKTYN